LDESAVVSLNYFTYSRDDETVVVEDFIDAEKHNGFTSVVMKPAGSTLSEHCEKVSLKSFGISDSPEVPLVLWQCPGRPRDIF